jgi:hypothetical protein
MRFLFFFQVAELRMVKSDANLQIVIAILSVVFFSFGLIFRKRLEFNFDFIKSILGRFRNFKKRVSISLNLLEWIDDLFASGNSLWALQCHLHGIH